MKRNKKLLVSFLAVNSILSAYAAGTETVVSPRYDRMYNSIVKNIEKGSSNQKTYEIIEQILNQKNKELKDLYLRGDYIVKPEYLEWQVFFTGFYDEYSEGRDNSQENAKYHSKVTGYYDTNGNYIVTSGSINGLAGKPHQSLQQPKEIDLGIGIQVREPDRQPITLGVAKPSMPLVTPIAPMTPGIAGITPVLPPLASFSVPNIGIPTPPIGVTVNAPVVSSIVFSQFNPVNPVISSPSVFDAPLLNKVATGFGQGTPMGINAESNVAVGNASLVGHDAVTRITTYNSGWNSSGAFDWYGSREWQTASGTYAGGTTGTGVYKYTFLNALADSFYIQGNWEFINGTTGTTTPPSGNVVGAARFVSVNHAFTSKGKTIVFNLDGNLNIKGRADGKEITVGIEHQAFDALHAEAKNNAVMTLESGKYLVGFNLIIESEWRTGCYYDNSGNSTLDSQCTPSGKQRTQESTSIKSTAENNGKIVIKSEDSIGIDFGQYVYGSQPLTIGVFPGDIEIEGKHNYGVRIPNVFSSVSDYYRETLINGMTRNTVTSAGVSIPSHQGLIFVSGEENVGLSLSR
ncbi:MAG: transporter, partial [Fusobacteriales bacterium]|nr:transporter [Fusobacteriales bacterium]